MSSKEDDDDHLLAMKQYYKRCQENNIIVQPFFLTFDNNLLYICQDRVNITQALALNEYLENTWGVRQELLRVTRGGAKEYTMNT